MFEGLRDALIWVASWVVDRRLHSEQAFRILFLIAFAVVATLLILYWKDLAFRSSAIRRRFLSGERYAGRYLQALWRNNEVRYSFVDIFYNPRRRGYEVRGRTYTSSGQRLGDFKSAYVRFPSRKDANIEFIWRGSGSAQGFARMTLEDSADHYIQGKGQVITFDVWPRAYPLRFKPLHDHHVREALGVSAPASSREEPDFVKKFHQVFGPSVMEGFGGGAKADAKAEAQPATGTALVVQR